MANLKTITTKAEAAQIYLQILARLAVAVPENLQIVPYHEAEKTNTIQVRLIHDGKTLDRKIILNQHPTAAELMTILNISYDLIEIDRGNKPHYQKGSKQTFDQQVNADIADVDAYMDEFEKLAPQTNIEDFRIGVDEKMKDTRIQGLIADALGASRKRVSETIIKSPKV